MGVLKKERNMTLIHWVIWFCLSLTIIYNSGYLIMTTSSSIGVYLLIIATAPLAILMLKSGLLLRPNNWFVIGFYTFFGTYVFSFIVNMEIASMNLYLHYLLSLVFVFSLVVILDFDRFVVSFLLLMKWITVISLIMFFLIEYLGIVFDFNLIENINGRMYFDAILYFYPQYGLAARNQALFWEPGLFASFLIIAMVFEICFKKEKISKLNMVIFFIGLATAQSTAGFVLFLLVIILLISKNKKNSSLIIIYLFILLLGTLLLIFYRDVVLFLSQFSPELFNKLIYEGGFESTRFSAPLVNLNIFFSNPLFGVGLGSATRLFTDLGAMYGVFSQTSTSTFFLAALGFSGIFYTIFWVYSILNLKRLNSLSRFIILTIFLIILNKEPHYSILVTNCILFYFLKEASIGYGNKLSKYKQ
ncbi:hypothetical protein ACQCT5_06920 [Sutcliffiella halmapala]